MRLNLFAARTYDDSEVLGIEWLTRGKYVT
jgi:hypothetical protein